MKKLALLVLVIAGAFAVVHYEAHRTAAPMVGSQAYNAGWNLVAQHQYPVGLDPTSAQFCQTLYLAITQLWNQEAWGRGCEGAVTALISARRRLGPSATIAAR